MGHGQVLKGGCLIIGGTILAVMIGVSFEEKKTIRWASTNEKNNEAVVTNTTTDNLSQKWIPAGTNIWQGVKLYSGKGNDKIYVGQVMAWSENYTIPGTGEKIRAIQIQMHDGSIEWKDREYIIWNTFVKKNDPAVK